jgi:FemAB-related protein (PEP-CTERM system-associated)
MVSIRNVIGLDRSLFSLPFAMYGGPLAYSSAVKNALIKKAIEFTQKKGFSYLELRNFQDIKDERLRTHSNYCSMILELDKDTETLWNNALEAKTRNQVRKAQKSGLYHKISRQKIGDFYTVYSENMRDLGTPVHSKKWFLDLTEELGEKLDVIMVYHEGRPIAGVLLLIDKSTVIVQYGASLKEYQKLCPNNLAYWEAIKYSCGRGHKTFDFGRSIYDSGTYKFKQQWGAKPHPVYYQYFLNKAKALPRIDPHDPKYRYMVGLWQRLPLPLSRFLGGAIRRNIP